ncbi:1-hydroxycarotenoid 3,4-desaturase CrtD [Marinoscillum sp. 108]|uniref:1-hydroxycarotenoid 3,4-desaturase CrtD n=1 Tax=Marinoscillum sp. 108 TaxID=2653151 RepID=UPI0012F0F28A|nr:1-hydroxycarotenoid 3,4-desaturase CrtD [Marinoscillum sp. 108]VXD21009.1 1-hydroxycarotenoid 3,4-desaturase [Marinoscillum sp. 108]
MSYKVGIIGSGVAGLASAIRLAIAGHRVEVFEANAYPGGKLSEIKLGAYRFDAGPSLLTLPSLIDELFELAGENPAQYFTYQKLEINCEYFFPDGVNISAHADHEKLIEEIIQNTAERPENVRKALAKSQLLYEHLSELFMFSSLQDPKTFVSRPAFKAYRKLHRLGFFQTMNGANASTFDDPRITQMFNRYATYNGSSPYKTPATMNIIPHLEMSLGAYFPAGGMHSITLALYDLAKRLGVIFHFNQPVERILIEKGHAKGLMTGGLSLDFDRLVSNMDIVNSYRKLMPDLKAPRFLLNQPKSSSALIFYWGVGKKFPQLDLHNILFSRDYKAEFEHIFQRGVIFHDPTVYINITSRYEPSDAPEHGENWFTMINVPNNQGQNWEELITEARKNILNKITATLGEDIAPLIEVEEILDPRTIESKTSSALGALYGNSSNNLFAAFLRHANKSRRVKGLYFCGGSVHPGGGIPMSLSSAKLVAKYFR